MRFCLLIWAKSTNLLFINPTGYLIRTIAIGGNVMSQNISDSLGITFEKAESLKKAYFAQEINLRRMILQKQLYQLPQTNFLQGQAEITGQSLHTKD